VHAIQSKDEPWSTTLTFSAHALTQTLQTHGLHVRHTIPEERKRFNVKNKRNNKTEEYMQRRGKTWL
jgi:hypothetical protein